MLWSVMLGCHFHLLKAKGRIFDAWMDAIAVEAVHCIILS